MHNRKRMKGCRLVFQNWYQSGITKYNSRWLPQSYLAIASNGWWFTLSLNPILIQNNFTFYWKYLAEWLDDNCSFGFKNVAVILDNCLSHRSKTTVDYLKRKNWSIYFLPPYSLQLAPVKLTINRFKSHLKFKDRKALLKLSKVDSLSYSLKIIKSVT